MDTIILQPTPTAEWHALIEEAKLRNAYSITDEIESYLVFLLMRFCNKPELAQCILATDFLKSFEQQKMERLASLRMVGDTCLLFAGLFPGRAQKRRVRISYFVKLGQMAYSTLAEARNSKLGDLYADLAEQFVILMDIMHCMRELNENNAAIDFLQAEELWNDTKSLHALNTLRKATQGFMASNVLLFPHSNTDPNPNNSSTKH